MRIWLNEIPTEEGWYWMQYKGKRGRVICPASVMWFDKEVFFVKTANNDTLSSNNRRQFGWFRFGPKIEIPDTSLTATI